MGNAKVTIYFQLIASKCRISNNRLQNTKKNVDLTNLLKGRHSNAWIFHFLKHTRFLLEKIEQEVIISVRTQDAWTVLCVNYDEWESSRQKQSFTFSSSQRRVRAIWSLSLLQHSRSVSKQWNWSLNAWIVPLSWQRTVIGAFRPKINWGCSASKNQTHSLFTTVLKYSLNLLFAWSHTLLCSLNPEGHPDRQKSYTIDLRLAGIG